MSRDRLGELLAGESVGDLSDAERAELAHLESHSPAAARAERAALERVAGALAASGPPGQLPGDLRRRVGGGGPSTWGPFAAGFATAAGIAVAVAVGWSRPASAPPRPAAGWAHYRAADGAEATWHAASQSGDLEVRGLEPNDPRTSRYQIWVVDAARPAPHRRVDGGLFDVPTRATHRLPIRATLPVGDAEAFAVTREGPHGSVVSAAPLLSVYAPVEP